MGIGICSVNPGIIKEKGRGVEKSKHLHKAHGSNFECDLESGQ